MITIRRSEERGPTRLSWLDSMHTFSFGDYYDPEHLGVSVLRVINDDTVKPGAGFETHSHEDMEILSYVTEGVIEHRDSMGNVERLPAGEFQLMSAGTGITHSEYNASQAEPLRFLQIWVIPNVKGIEPGYQQKQFPRYSGTQLILSPDGRDGSLKIHQDAAMHQVALGTGETAEPILADGRLGYLHIVHGTLTVNGQEMQAGDGATIDESEITLTGVEAAEALLFDLPAVGT